MRPGVKQNDTEITFFVNVITILQAKALTMRVKEGYYNVNNLASAPVAQLDRASVYGAEGKKSQATKNKEVIKPAEGVLSSCLAISVSETIEKHSELKTLIQAWLELPEHIKAAIKALIKTHNTERR